MLSGLQAEENIAHGEAVHRVMETHELLGFITLAIFGVLAVWRIWRERRMGTTERALAMALSLGGAGVLIATAAYGGRLVFEHAAGIPTEVLTSEIRERAEGHEHAPGEEHRRRSRARAHRRSDGRRFGRPATRGRRSRRSTGDPAAQPRAQGARRAQPFTRHAGARTLGPVTSRAWIAAAALLAACRPNTTRPAITPYPEAAGVEIRPRPPEATRRLAEALQADSITPARVRLRDGYIETAWLDSADRPADQRGARSAPGSSGFVRGPIRAAPATRCSR